MTVVAYLVLSHTRPEQVLRLVRTLRELSPASPVLVHHNPQHTQLDARSLGATMVDAAPVEWGRRSQLEALLRGLGTALRGPAFDWLTVVSGQDYPVRHPATVAAELAACGYDGFAEGHLVRPPDRDGDEFGRRYFMAWRPIREPGRPARRAIAAARPLLALRDMPTGPMLGRRVRTPFSAAVPCRRGADWLTLTRRAVGVVAGAARTHPGLHRHFLRTLMPTEAYAHTVLHAHGLRLSADLRRFTVWTPGAASPRLLGMDDLDAISRSRADFARKFDQSVDWRVLDELDRRLRS